MREPFTGSRLLPIAILSGFVAVLFHRVVLGGVLFWSDTHLTFEPLFGLLGDALRSCRLLWSSLLETGKPILGNPTQAPLYPPNLLFTVFEAPRAISILTVGHVLLGSLGASTLARRLGAGFFGAVTAGLVFAGAGATLAAVPYHGLAWCTAWIPWLLLLCDRVAHRERSLGNMLLMALVVFAMLTIMEPFVLIAANLGIAVWLVGGLVSTRGTRRRRSRDWVVLPAAAAAVGVVAASPHLVAVLVSFPDSVRSLGFTWDGVTIWSLHPIRLIECLAPGVLGVLGRPGDGAFWALATVPIKGFPYLAGLYIGVPVLALAAAGALGRFRGRLALTVWLGVLVLLALGRWGPLYPWLEHVPVIDAARYPVKWLVPAVVPLSLLAGLGLDGLFGRSDVRSRYGFFAAAGGSALVLATILVAIRFPWFDRLVEASAMAAGGVTPAVRHVVEAACLRGLLPAVVGIAVVAAAIRYRMRPGLATLALSALVAVDLAAANTRLVATTAIGFYRDQPDALRIVRSDPGGFERIKVDENASHAARWAARNPTLLEISTFQRQILAGYEAARFGVPTAFTRDTEATGPKNVYLLRALGESAPTREQAMVFGSASITHLVTDRGIEHPLLPRLGSVRTVAGTTIHVYRNTLAQPRVRVVPAVVPYHGDDGYRNVVRGSSTDLFARVALIDTDDLDAAPAGLRELVSAPDLLPAGGAGSARIVADLGHLLTVNAESSAPVVLVVSDAYVPQWSATVDGVDAPVFRADYAFRGVLLEPGRHTVVLEYHPWRR